MKEMTHRLLALASATMAITALSGCWTSPTQMPPIATNPSQTRNWLVLETAHGGATLQANPGGSAPQPSDAKARVLLVDRSYRLLSVMYEDGRTQTFKVGLPDTLPHVHRGEFVLVRAQATQ